MHKGELKLREVYQEFLERINSFEKKELSLGEGDFVCNSSVVNKVDEQNRFRAFYGDTVVFNLDNNTKKWLEEIVGCLYDKVPGCFAEKLAEHTYHVTLHDLSNSQELQRIAEELFWNELKVISVAEKVCNMGLGDAVIKMKAKCIFNMVNTSLVLGLYPADEVEYEKMMQLYEVFDEVKRLPYPLTPHITLAYYNVNGFSSAMSQWLSSVVNELNEQITEREIVLKCRELFYQKFLSMNEYIDVVSIGKILL